MLTVAQSAANWHNMHTYVDCMHSLTHLINTVTITWWEAPAPLLQNLESNFYFEGTLWRWGEGFKREYPEKTPDSLVCLSVIALLVVAHEILNSPQRPSRRLLHDVSFSFQQSRLQQDLHGPECSVPEDPGERSK